MSGPRAGAMTRADRDDLLRIINERARMIVRFGFRRRDLDDHGVLKPDSLRRLARALWDCPADLRVIVDLGPCRQLQRQLIRDLTLYGCAPSVRFVGTDWRAVQSHTGALVTALEVAA